MYNCSEKRTKDKEDICETEVNNMVSDIVAESFEFERSWADLPYVLLSEIFSRVFVDRHQVVFCLVCKSWNSALQSPIPTEHQFQPSTTDSFPHQFFTSKKLIHPILEKVSQLNKFSERTLGVNLCTTKEDWLLFSQNDFRRHKPSKAFFFNPFTQAIIWLPDLIGSPESMCFTSPPTSVDFKLIVVRSSEELRFWKKIVVDTINFGEDSWTSCEFEYGEESLFKFSHGTPVLYKGKCYILATDSTLLHDLKKKTFFLHKAPESLHHDVGDQYMLESDGKLLAIFVETSGSWVLVCRWVDSARKWVKLKSLGNKALFVSRPYSVSETSYELRNRIYFPRLMDTHCLFYSMDTKRFHISDGSSFKTFHGSKSTFSSTWIKPPCTLCEDN